MIDLADKLPQLHAAVVSERCWRSQQAWNYELIIDTGNTKLRVKILRDFYDFQSYARAERWNGEMWKHVNDLHISECKCKEVSSVDRAVAADAFHEDVVKLLTVAWAILT